MSTDSKAELLPCPFCGGEAHFEMDDDRWEWVECGSCGMQGNRSASLMEDCKPKLAEAWNRRAPSVPVPQGWKIVPLKPTAQMKRAAQIADMDHSPHSEWLKDEWQDKQRVWSAMLATAPKTPKAATVRNPLTDAEIESATGAKQGTPLFLAAKGFTIAIERAHGIGSKDT